MHTPFTHHDLRHHHDPPPLLPVVWLRRLKTSTGPPPLCRAHWRCLSIAAAARATLLPVCCRPAAASVAVAVTCVVVDSPTNIIIIIILVDDDRFWPLLACSGRRPQQRARARGAADATFQLCLLPSVLHACVLLAALWRSRNGADNGTSCCGRAPYGHARGGRHASDRSVPRHHSLSCSCRRRCRGRGGVAACLWRPPALPSSRRQRMQLISCSCADPLPSANAQCLLACNMMMRTFPLFMRSLM